MATTSAERAERPPARPGKRRRRILTAAAAALLLAGLLTLIGTLRHLDHQYGPLQGGEFGGPYSDRGFVFSTSGPSFHLADAPGATGRLMGSVSNLGAHSVKITSIEYGDMVTGIKWSVYRTVPGGYVSGVATPWHAFPAIVPAQGTIRLLITIRRPGNCDTYPVYHGVSDANYDGINLVHWQSLLHSHTTPVDIYLSFGDGIHVC